MTLISFIENLDVTKFSHLSDDLECTIGVFGGRRFTHKMQGVQGTISLNELVQALDAKVQGLVANSQFASNSTTYEECQNAVQVVAKLDKRANRYVKEHANVFQRVLTKIKSIVASLFYDRQRVLSDILYTIEQRKSVQPVRVPKFLSPKVVVSKPIKPLTAEQKNFIATNPYIHGTSSLIFATLPKCDHQIDSIWSMLQKNIAPLGGEIICGGTDMLMVKGETSFGRVKANTYGLAEVISRYAKPIGFDPKATAEKHKSTIRELFMRAIDSYRLTQALIFAQRARQMGIRLFDESVKIDATFFEEIRLLITTHYLVIAFLAKFVRAEEKSDVHLEKHLISFLLDNTIDLESYVFEQELPHDENMQRLEQFFQSYNFSLSYKTHARFANTESTSPVVDEFICSTFGLERAELTSQHQKAVEDPDVLLEHIQELEKRLKYFIGDVNKHFELLCETLFSQEAVSSIFDCNDKMITDPFGVVFMSGDEKSFKAVQKEYRATRPLALGKEITMLATRNENISQVQSYLDAHQISGVEVVAFEALKSVIG